MIPKDELIEKWQELKVQRDKLAIEARKANSVVDASMVVSTLAIHQRHISEINKLVSKLKALQLKQKKVWNAVIKRYLIVCSECGDNIDIVDNCWHDFVKYSRDTKYWGEVVVDTNIKSGVLAAIDRYCVVELVEDYAIASFVKDVIDKDLEIEGYNKLGVQISDVERQNSDLQYKIDAGAKYRARHKIAAYEKLRDSVFAIDRKMDDIKTRVKEHDTLYHNSWRIKRMLRGM